MTVQNENKKKILAAPLDSTMKLSGLSTGQTTSETQSIIDPLFTHWLPQRIREQKHLVKIMKTIYQWNILRNGQVVAVWTLDLKNDEGSVYSGSPKNTNPDCTITLDEKEALDLFEGKLDPAKAFMQGKFRISGNLMAAHKFQQFWSEELSKGTGQSIKEFMQNLGSGSTSAIPTVSSIEPFPTTNDTALLESIPISGLKSDIAFNIMKSRMHEEPDLIKAFRFIIQFNITKDKKHAISWTVDTKTDGGRVYRAAAKDGKCDATVTIDDENFTKIIFDKLNPQRAFMTGKVHVKGNILLLQRLDTFFTQVKNQRVDPELPLVMDIMLNDPLIPGLRSEAIIFEFIQRLVRLPKLCNENLNYKFDIHKNGKHVSTWTLTFTSSNEFGVFKRGSPKNGDAHCTIIIEDDDFVRLAYNTLKLDEAIQKGRIKVLGDKNLIGKINKLFATPTLRAKL